MIQARYSRLRHLLFTLVMAATGVGIIVTALVQAWDGLDFVSLILLCTLWILATYLGVRLGGGDMVYIDASVGLAALVLFGSAEVFLAAAVGGLIGVVSNPREDSLFLERAAEVSRKLLVLAVLSPSAHVVSLAVVGNLTGLAAQASLLVFGLMYALLDLLTLALAQSLRSGANIARELIRVSRPIALVYVGHVSTGVVIVLLFDSLGYVALLAMTALVLMMQNNFNLLLRIRTAYQETIQALVHAVELQLPGEEGHAKRVADLSARAGRYLGLSGASLERVGYAALLHDIGKIGDERCAEAGSPDEHARVGAEIVEQIPFVSLAAPVVLRHEDRVADICTADDNELLTAVLLVKAASRLDRAVLVQTEDSPVGAILSSDFDDFRSTAAGMRVVNALYAIAGAWTMSDVLSLGGVET
ncbi:MAG: HD domain-containing protein [Coriobacteriia bacterium]|nr:HD domain-containing protein [Coriobacteriia bacterium]MBN2823631.1 HD domain-containing protein [Coriobacteriia bacterium]